MLYEQAISVFSVLDWRYKDSGEYYLKAMHLDRLKSNADKNIVC